MNRRPRLASRTIVIVALVAGLAAATWGVVGAVGAGDNDMPGVPLPASPVTGSLDDYVDFDDVYAVRLQVNDKLEVSMTGDDGTQFDIWLWSPGTKSIFTEKPLSRVIQSSQDPASSSETFWYPVRNAGTYYLHVFNPLDSALASRGTYRLSYEVTRLPSPTVSLKAPATVGWGKTASIAGTVTLDGEGQRGARVLIQSKAAGSSAWKDLNFDKVAYRPKTVANDAGRFTYSVKPTKKTQYRAVVWPTENSGWRFGAATSVAPRVRLGAPHAPSSVKRKTAFKVYGYTAPRRAARAKTVTLVFTRGARTVRVRAVNANHSSVKWGRSTRYNARVSLPTKGKWKVVATTGGDSLYAATTSTARYVTVK